MFGFLPQAATMAGVGAGEVTPAKRSLYARMFDKLSPGGDLSDADKEALFRQGLLGLAAGMAQTGGQGVAGALGNGLQSGLLAMNNGREDMSQREYRKRALGDPAGMREFDALTEGLTDEEKAKARRVRLGIEGRASSAGMGFETWTDANGVPRPARMDPRSGQYEIYLEERGGWIPLGAAQRAAPGILGGAPASVPQGPSDGLLGPTFNTPQGPAAIGTDLPPQVQAQLQQMLASGQQIPSVLPTQPPAGLGRGRRAEDEAAAVAAAQRGVELSTLPAELGMRTGAAIQEADATADITTRATAERERQKAEITRQAEQAAKDAARARDSASVLDLLDEAEQYLPRATGSIAGSAIDTAAGAFGKATEGGKASAQLRAIAGQLTARMPRMEGPQSNYDVQLYREMAGDLANSMIPREQRLAALETIRQLNQKYAGGQALPEAAPSSGRRLKFNPATGKIE